MKRAQAGTIVALIGATLIVIGLASSHWLISIDPYTDPDALPGPWHGWLGSATWGAGLACALAALPMIVTRARVLCAVVIAVASVALFGGVWIADRGSRSILVGHVATAWLLGASAMIAAAMLLVKDGVPPPPPRDGRHLVYDDDGKLIRIEHYEAGEKKRVEDVKV